MKKIFIIILFSLALFSCSNNSISTVSIGKENSGNKEQIWMIKNLDVSTYRDGTVIPEVTDPAEWSKLTTGAWCYYDNESSKAKVYGKLYNWYAVNDPRGLAPEGFHIPSADEWNALTDYLSIQGVGYSIGDKLYDNGSPGLKLKEKGNAHWAWDNEDATNSSGFTGLPGGIRSLDGDFQFIGVKGHWWSSTERDLSSYYNSAWQWSLSYDSWSVDKYDYEKRMGLSVRCIKD